MLGIYVPFAAHFLNINLHILYHFQAIFVNGDFSQIQRQFKCFACAFSGNAINLHKLYILYFCAFIALKFSG